MEFKATQKAVKQNYYHTIKVPYCGLQHLLAHKNRTAYTAGVYGWNADVYEVKPNTAIITGYRPFGNIEPPYELTEDFDTKAQHILYNYAYDYEERTELLNELIDEYIERVTK